MAELTIESNGRLEKTAVFFNGEQLAGIREIMLNLDEDGTFNAIIQFKGTDNKVHTKQIFTENLEYLKVTEPTFTEEEALQLQQVTIESDGDIEETFLYLNEEELEGVVSAFLHIKSNTSDEKSLPSLFGKKKKIVQAEVCNCEITFRNEDDSLETEKIF